MSDKKNVKTRQVVTAHPSSLKHSNSNNAQSTSFWTKLKRNWSITVATLLSVVWISFCVYLARQSDLNPIELPLIELATLLSAVSLPLIIIWVICLVVMRANPIEENYRSLEAEFSRK